MRYGVYYDGACGTLKLVQTDSLDLAISVARANDGRVRDFAQNRWVGPAVRHGKGNGPAMTQ